jgi:hypothetical protein
MKMLRPLGLLLLTLLLASCQRSDPLRTVTEGEQIASYDFSEPTTFEEGSYGDARLRIAGGVYQINIERGAGEVWWGQWGDTYSDVIITAEITQTTEPQETAYGLMCRVRGATGQEQEADPTLAAIIDATDMPDEATDAPTDEATAEATDAADDATPTADDEATEGATDEATIEATAADDEATDEPTAEATEAATVDPDATPSATPIPNYGEGDGYLFLVQGSGSYGIFRARGRNLTPLVDWAASDVVNPALEMNTLRAVCVGDYLALYVNGQLLAQTTDSTYTEGQVGMVASASNRLGARVQFDNLTVYEGRSS